MPRCLQPWAQQPHSFLFADIRKLLGVGSNLILPLAPSTESAPCRLAFGVEVLFQLLGTQLPKHVFGMHATLSIADGDVLRDRTSVVVDRVGHDHGVVHPHSDLVSLRLKNISFLPVLNPVRSTGF